MIELHVYTFHFNITFHYDSVSITKCCAFTVIVSPLNFFFGVGYCISHKLYVLFMSMFTMYSDNDSMFVLMTVCIQYIYV